MVFAPVSNRTSPSPAGLKSSCASADNVGLINGTTELSTEVVHIASPTQEDLIGTLTEPTDCGLWIIFHGVECEAAIGVVQPEQTTPHTVPIHKDCVVVEVLRVYAVFRDHALEHPPNDEVTTLGQTLHQGYSGRGVTFTSREHQFQNLVRTLRYRFLLVHRLQDKTLPHMVS